MYYFLHKATCMLINELVFTQNIFLVLPIFYTLNIRLKLDVYKEKICTALLY